MLGDGSAQRRPLEFIFFCGRHPYFGIHLRRVSHRCGLADFQLRERSAESDRSCCKVIGRSFPKLSNYPVVLKSLHLSVAKKSPLANASKPDDEGRQYSLAFSQNPQYKRFQKTTCENAPEGHRILRSVQLTQRFFEPRPRIGCASPPIPLHACRRLNVLCVQDICGRGDEKGVCSLPRPLTQRRQFYVFGIQCMHVFTHKGVQEIFCLQTEVWAFLLSLLNHSSEIMNRFKVRANRHRSARMKPLRNISPNSGLEQLLLRTWGRRSLKGLAVGKVWGVE